MTDEFVLGQVQSFILYFHERGDVTNTWQSKFVEHCKLWWRSTGGAGQGDLFPRQTLPAGRKGRTDAARNTDINPSEDGNTFDAMVDRLTDRSWAE